VGSKGLCHKDVAYGVNGPSSRILVEFLRLKYDLCRVILNIVYLKFYV
jgi:hypothetical protein